jgi:hypothetical protein
MHVANAGAIKLGDYPQALLEAIDYSLKNYALIALSGIIQER